MRPAWLICLLSFSALADSPAPDAPVATPFDAVDIRSAHVIGNNGQAFDVEGGAYLPSPVLRSTAKRIASCETEVAELRKGPDILTVVAVVGAVLLAGGVGFAAARLTK